MLIECRAKGAIETVKEVGLTLIQQPPYVEEVLKNLASYPDKVKRLTCWNWIMDAFQSLSNMTLP